MSTPHVQVIVIGAGALGSATAYWLAKQGRTDVTVLEQFELGHARGASVDHHRAIRHSYHDNKYGRLTQPAFDNWDAVSAESGIPLITRTGGVEIGLVGTVGEDMIHAYRRILDANGHPYEEWDNTALTEHYPQWSVPEPALVTYQKDMGFVDIGKAGQVHRALATNLGVTFQGNTNVVAIETTGDGIRVHTRSSDPITAEYVVVCTGAWTDTLLADLGQTWRTSITQEQVSYFVPKDLPAFTTDRFPVWGWYGPTLFYGFPMYGEVGIKIARDMSGKFVTNRTRSFDPDPGETALLSRFLESRIPDAAGVELISKTCIYDMPPDRDFIIDFMPGHPRVIVGNGAGHAGKFAGLFGQILSQLVIDGRSTYPISEFSASRPALTDPKYVPAFSL